MRDLNNVIRVADRLIDWKMVDRASELLERCLEHHPGHPELLRRLGHIRLAQGRSEEAAGLLEQVVRHDRMMAPLREQHAAAGLATTQCPE